MVRAALRLATGILEREGIDGAARDARRMMAHALGVGADRVTLHLGDEMTVAQEALFRAFVERRLDRQPVSQIVGARLFHGREFLVTPDVLDPRPETETLVHEALSKPFASVLDLGTGTGCILLSLLSDRPEARGVGVDRSAAALGVAERNAERLGVAGRCKLIQSDWFEAVEGRFDLIVSNPPYIAAEEMAALAPELAHEPRMALTDEGDGLGAYRAIARGAAAHLAPAGRILLEIGPTQGESVASLLSGAGFGEVRIVPDLDDRDRVVVAKAPESA
ncbi:peptide chain release factor N(5)-glutamine methyltransferase [Roseovarius sp. SCSIO 43702]|uniref:peptide chain release factor N(5)-glutamine methyltransferase n=1 Tax=Roseovarius sp. SCSIO 43702 TaxID=2823043 RepID=UPI001C72EFB0|nr:peptide chain release factor N(5)-glutamine methyltransferase [Roseovarius sp. SCSIO 43702]QYX58569.1 peptide chain release factor N(5)-glutamine methyltransferase [Roseovarius sp. SCSIO 43702]